MKAYQKKRATLRCEKPARKLRLALGCVLTFATGLFAQSVFVTPPVIPPIAAPPSESSSSSDTNQVDSAGTSNSSGSTSNLRNRNPFQWGPLTLHPHAGYSYTYGTGIQSQPGQGQRTAVNGVSAGLGVDLGQHWQLSYSAGASFYSDPNFRNNVDHTFSLAGKTTYGDWDFSLSQNVALSSDPLVETAQQTDQQSYTTAFGTSYQINSDFSFDLTLGQNLRDLQGFTNALGSSRDWTALARLNYQWLPTVHSGLGVGFGYNNVSTGPDMTYEDLQGSVSWQIARKFSLSLNGGVEIRQMLGTGLDSLISPTFGGVINYQPFQQTALYLTASRGVGASYFQDDVTISTSVSVGASQRIFQKFYFNMAGGYSVSSYQSSLNGQSGREDTRNFFNIGLSTTFLTHGTASINYSKSKNSSKNSVGHSYDSDQFVLSLGFGY